MKHTPSGDDHAMACLLEQGFPRGLAHSVIHLCRNAFPQRVWIVDNSGSMMTHDGRKLVSTKRKNEIQWTNCTRWEELKECVTYHAQMAALLTAPTKFIWLNPPSTRNKTLSHDIGVLGSEWVEDELESLFHTLRETSPSGVTPLTCHLQNLYSMLLPVKESLLREGQQVVVCLATDGIPTDDNGVMASPGTVARAEFERALRRLLHDLPVWMVIRLCTNDDTVLQYYEELERHLELNLEVLDDYLDEAKEVNKCNPWLTYGLPLHRCREMGFKHPLLDLLDERKLTLDEISRFVQLLLGGSTVSVTTSTTPINNKNTYCDPHSDWDGFFGDLKDDLSTHELTYHPIRKRLHPWIDLARLERVYGPQSHFSLFLQNWSVTIATIALLLIAILMPQQWLASSE